MNNTLVWTKRKVYVKIKSSKYHRSSLALLYLPQSIVHIYNNNRFSITFDDYLISSLFKKFLQNTLHLYLDLKNKHPKLETNMSIQIITWQNVTLD